MTRQNIMAMSEEEINLRVARDIMKLDVREFNSEHMGKPISGMLVYEKLGNIDCPIGNLPEYTKDLNLCYEVENALFQMLRVKRESLGIYVIELEKQLQPLHSGYNMIDYIHASPLARMRAALMCFAQ